MIKVECVFVTYDYDCVVLTISEDILVVVDV